jgi:opacity protein-like surface antigen
MMKIYMLATGLTFLASSALAADVIEKTGEIVVGPNNKAEANFSCPDGYAAKGIDPMSDRVTARFERNHTGLYFFNVSTEGAATINYVVVCVKY